MSLTFLPPEVLREKIIQEFPIEEILRLCSVSTYFRNAICRTTDPGFWRSLFRRDISEYRVPTQNIKEKYFEALQFLQLPEPRRIRELARRGYERLLNRENPQNLSPGSLIAIIREAATHNYRDILNRYLVPSMGKYQRYLNLAISRAARAGNLPLVNELIERKPPNIVLDMGEIITQAAASGNRELVDYLLKRGGDLNRALYGATIGKNFAMISYLLSRGADNYDLALRGAASICNMELVKFFEQLGARDYTRALTDAARTAAISPEEEEKCAPVRGYLLARGGNISRKAMRGIAESRPFNYPEYLEALRRQGRYNREFLTEALEVLVSQRRTQEVRQLLSEVEFAPDDIESALEVVPKNKELFTLLVDTLVQRNAHTEQRLYVLVSHAIREEENYLIEWYLDRFPLLLPMLIPRVGGYLIRENRPLLKSLLNRARAENLDIPELLTRALVRSVGNGNLESARLLIDTGVQISPEVMERAAGGPPEILIYLLDSLKRRREDVDLNPAIRRAVTDNNIENLRILLAAVPQVSPQIITYTNLYGSPEAIQVVSEYRSP